MAIDLHLDAYAGAFATVDKELKGYVQRLQALANDRNLTPAGKQGPRAEAQEQAHALVDQTFNNLGELSALTRKQAAREARQAPVSATDAALATYEATVAFQDVQMRRDSLEALATLYEETAGDSAMRREALTRLLDPVMTTAMNSERPSNMLGTYERYQRAKAQTAPPAEQERLRVDAALNVLDTYLHNYRKVAEMIARDGDGNGRARIYDFVEIGKELQAQAQAAYDQAIPEASDG